MTLSLWFSESNERLQTHLKERMHSLEEKNQLSNELERTKKKLEETDQNKARLSREMASLQAELLRCVGLETILLKLSCLSPIRWNASKSCKKRG